MTKRHTRVASVHRRTMTGKNVSDDYDNINAAYLSWLRAHEEDFQPFCLRIVPENLWHAAVDCAEYLGIYTKVSGAGPSVFKHASAVVLGCVTNNPISIITDPRVDVPKEAYQTVVVANACAAFWVGNALAIKTSKADRGTNWELKNLPRFPSVHTFLEFVRNICMELHKCRCGDPVDCDTSVANLLTSVALVLELCFYWSNGGYPDYSPGGTGPSNVQPCGSTDKDAIEKMKLQGAGVLWEVMLMDIDKYVPGASGRFLSRQG